MAITPVTLTATPRTLVGAAPDSPVRFDITTNVDGPIIDVDSNILYLGSQSVNVRADEELSASLPPTNGATNPTGFQYRVDVSYVDAATRERRSWSSGWFSLTVATDLADVVEEQYVPPTWMTGATATLQGYVDAAAAITGIDTTDEAVGSLISDPLIGPQTRGALDTFVDAEIAALGLGTAATKNTGTASGDVPLLGTGGRLDIARVASGTPDGTKFVRDDGTLAAPASGGGATLLGSASRTNATTTWYSTTSTSAVDVDATNLSVTFTVPASGRVTVLLSGVAAVNGTAAAHWSLRSGATNVAGSERHVTESSVRGRYFYWATISGLSPDASITYKWAYRSTASSISSYVYYGGANGEFGTAVNYGPATMEVWSA